MSFVPFMARSMSFLVGGKQWPERTFFLTFGMRTVYSFHALRGNSMSIHPPHLKPKPEDCNPSGSSTCTLMQFSSTNMQPVAASSPFYSHPIATHQPLTCTLLQVTSRPPSFPAQNPTTCNLLH